MRTTPKLGLAVAIATASLGIAGSPLATAAPHFLTQRTTRTSGGEIRQLRRALARLEHKLSSTYYTRKKINATFLTIRAAGNSFVKIGATAANASALGGVPASSYFHGRGNVLAGMTTLTTNGSSAPLLGDTSLSVQAAITSGVAGAPRIVLENLTQSNMRFTASGSSGTSPSGTSTLPPGAAGEVTIAPDLDSTTGTAQVNIQAFSATGVRTLTVSVLPSGPGDGFTAQMLVDALP
jgi:hypothetical protein